MSQTALRRRLRPVLALAIATACAVVALPATAGAAPGAGSVELTVGGKGKAAKALRASGVRVAAVRPAAKRGARIALPVRQVAVAGRAKVALAGGIRFRAGRRALRVGALRLVVAPRRAVLSARAGRGGRFALFTATLPKGRAKLDRDGGTARLAGARLALSRAAVGKLRRQLGARGLTVGPVGSVGLDARPRGGKGGGGNGGGTGGGGGGSGGGGGGPQAGPIGSEPPVLARPATAKDVTSASLAWRPRESWICYINSGEGTSVFGGAKNGPQETLPCQSGPENLVASFHDFPFERGWYDPVSGVAALYFAGGVGFRYSAHTINFSAARPEIEINAADSRAIFAFNGSEGTGYDNQRGVLVDLHPSPIQKPPAGEVVYTDIPATVPADAGASIFAGLYLADEPFGSLSVRFTVP